MLSGTAMKRFVFFFFRCCCWFRHGSSRIQNRNEKRWNGKESQKNNRFVTVFLTKKNHPKNQKPKTKKPSLQHWISSFSFILLILFWGPFFASWEPRTNAKQRSGRSSGQASPPMIRPWCSIVTYKTSAVCPSRRSKSGWKIQSWVVGPTWSFGWNQSPVHLKLTNLVGKNKVKFVFFFLCWEIFAHQICQFWVYINFNGAFVFFCWTWFFFVWNRFFFCSTYMPSHFKF